MSSCVFRSCLTGALLWTELVSGIHHHRWGHLQTVHLTSELLHLRLLQPSPPAEKVEMEPLPRLHVEADQDAVRTGCTDKGGVYVAVAESEAAALQGDVVRLVVAPAFGAHAAPQGDAAGMGVAAEGGGGTLSLFKKLDEGRVTQAACYESPAPL